MPSPADTVDEPASILAKVIFYFRWEVPIDTIDTVSQFIDICNYYLNISVARERHNDWAC